LAEKHSNAHDTTAHRLLGLVRSAVGIGLIVHAAMLAYRGFQHLGIPGLPHNPTTVYIVFVAEIALGMLLAADFIFRFICLVIGLMLLVLMLVILVGERLGVSDQVRRYPVAVFLICLTGLFTGIGEFGLFNYLRDIRMEKQALGQSG